MSKWLNIIALFAVAGLAHAHAELEESVPADKAVIETMPQELVLRFSAPVRLTALSVTRHGDAPADMGPLPSEPSREFRLPAPRWSAGSYTVEWRALAEDGHVMRGTFDFTVGLAAQSEEPHQNNTDHSHGAGHSQAH